ncbi:hypothetical protein NKI31_08380 [Mesorhizobium sp. M0659]|uniref:hypothetical protein n=1 Tax=Mesorhizobium sp. M0659 TaxID=2956980 RepID=UPI00333CF224
MAIEIYRHALSTGLGTLTSNGRFAAYAGGEEVSVRFETGGSVRGSTWRVAIDSTDFADLAAAMFKADPERAAKAFGKALATTKIT